MTGPVMIELCWKSLVPIAAPQTGANQTKKRPDNESGRFRDITTMQFEVIKECVPSRIPEVFQHDMKWGSPRERYDVMVPGSVANQR